MKSRLLAGIAALALAVIGAILVMSYANGADARALKDLEPAGVLVVSTAVPAGTAVESLGESVQTRQLPAAAVSNTALSSLDGLGGKVTAVDLVAGEQLLADRLVAPEDIEPAGQIDVPKGLQEISFQLEPQRVVGGRLAVGDHVGVLLSFDQGAIQDEPDRETTKFEIHKVLVTYVQRAPEPTPTEAAATPSEGEDTGRVEDTSLPMGSLLLTVAVDDVEAAKIAFTAEFGTLWLTKEPETATESDPRIITKTEVYK